MNLHNASKKSWFYPVLLLLVMLVAYGTQITRMGFYWDDWQAVFLSKMGSASAYWEYYFSDRPFSAWTYILTVPVLGTSPLPWQVFTLLVRWGSVLAFCWALSGIWPQRLRQIGWMGILLAVYPGFTQQAVSVAYSQHFISYALFTASLGLMIWASLTPKRFFVYTALALLAALLELATMEYFFGLELLRPFILWILLRSSREKQPGPTGNWFRLWLPYLAVLLVFLAWRFIIYPGLLTGSDENQALFFASLAKSPTGAFLEMAQRILQDSIHLLGFAWLNTIHPDTIELQAKAFLLSWALGIAAAILLVWADRYRYPAPADPVQNQNSFHSQAALLGILGILLGGLPVWITERQIIVGSWSDRFSLAPMLGAVILIVCLADWYLQDRRRSTFLLAFLACISIAAHVRNTNKYRLNWDIQRDYYWQMTWRVPSLQPGTAVLGPKYPFSLVADYSVAYAVNILYADQFESARTPYWFLAGPWKIAKDDPGLQSGIPIKDQLRNIVFNSSTQQSLGVGYYPSRGCLLVLDPVYRDAPQITQEERSIFSISHPGQILPAARKENAVPQDIFGQEPARDWCYYFQKADLARQNQEWQKIVALGAEAESLGYKPSYSAEWLPFLEANARLGNWDQALAATLQAFQLNEESQLFLCSAWERISPQTENSPEKQSALLQVGQSLQCPSPGPE